MDVLQIVFSIIIGVIIVIILLKLKTKKTTYGIESKTINGKKVRSKKEKIVGDYLESKKIVYEYEREVIVGNEKMLSDFYLPKMIFTLSIGDWTSLITRQEMNIVTENR